MKRNILLLTAVVLAAVMMTGCILPFMGVKVEYKWEPETVKEDFNQKKLVTKVKKNSTATIELFFTDQVKEEDRLVNKYVIKVEAGEQDITPSGEAAPKVTTDKQAITFDIPVEKTGIKVTVSPAS